MSIESLKLFIEKMQHDELMQDKFKKISEEERENSQAKLVELGAEAGFEFNEVDLQQMMEETTILMQRREELDDTELEAVVGGSQADWDALTRVNYTACVYTTFHQCDPKERLKKYKSSREPH